MIDYKDHSSSSTQVLKKDKTEIYQNAMKFN